MAQDEGVEQTWLDAARKGDAVVLGNLLEKHRAYLTFLARTQVHRRLQSKVDASDIVQEVAIVAQQRIATFRGSQMVEFTAWLRSILANLIARQYRHYYGTQGRDVRLEQSLAVELDHASSCIERTLPGRDETPSHVAMRRETVIELAEALENLSEDYRTAILLRNMEGLSFPEIATIMNRSVDSVEKIWIRGLGKLRSLLDK